MGVAAVILAAVLKGAYALQQRGNVEITQQQVKTLLSALDSYYYRYCWQATKPTPTIATLVSHGLIESSAIGVSPYGSSFALSISWSSPAYYEVALPVTSGNVTALSTTLSPTRVAGTTLYWRDVPTFNDVGVSSGETERFVKSYNTGCD